MEIERLFDEEPVETYTEEEEIEVIKKYFTRFNEENICDLFSRYIEMDSECEYESRYIEDIRRAIKGIFYELCKKAIKIGSAERKTIANVKETEDFVLVLEYIYALKDNPNANKRKIFDVIKDNMLFQLGVAPF